MVVLKADHPVTKQIARHLYSGTPGSDVALDRMRRLVLPKDSG